ncbi:uncharacterized protein BDR25DRAFT_351678 [Lindgomyces ingoldianus]|uniref:Uncharacterized protein n=1 Tax=Lindgomyces ingoldianus TaxID=673940 RepID=A0ACB6R4S0_9PLEO|nr:uncharacterized protein BDR25DRAFT_351678 [Lindgomyces ingoldianus]KAF2474146.1 hypothetical protein BDR25DRAFT_351678 [Lindgomyces ingoldianus]
MYRKFFAYSGESVQRINISWLRSVIYGEIPYVLLAKVSYLAPKCCSIVTNFRMPTLEFLRAPQPYHVKTSIFSITLTIHASNYYENSSMDSFHKLFTRKLFVTRTGARISRPPNSRADPGIKETPPNAPTANQTTGKLMLRKQGMVVPKIAGPTAHDIGDAQVHIEWGERKGKDEDAITIVFAKFNRYAPLALRQRSPETLEY